MYHISPEYPYPVIVESSEDYDKESDIQTINFLLDRKLDILKEL